MCWGSREHQETLHWLTCLGTVKPKLNKSATFVFLTVVQQQPRVITCLPWLLFSYSKKNKKNKELAQTLFCFELSWLVVQSCSFCSAVAVPHIRAEGICPMPCSHTTARHCPTAGRWQKALIDNTFSWICLTNCFTSKKLLVCESLRFRVRSVWMSREAFTILFKSPCPGSHSRNRLP